MTIRKKVGVLEEDYISITILSPIADEYNKQYNYKHAAKMKNFFRFGYTKRYNALDSSKYYLERYSSYDWLSLKTTVRFSFAISSLKPLSSHSSKW